MIKENEPITAENEVLRERYLLELSDKIFDHFNNFCISQNIQDMRKEPQNIFRAALKYIQFNVFHNTDNLKQKIDTWDNFVPYKGRFNFRFLLDILFSFNIPFSYSFCIFCNLKLILTFNSSLILLFS